MKLKNQKIRVKLTGNCNKSCEFCHEEGGMKKIEDMGFDSQFKKCVKELQEELEFNEIIFTGGEPLLNKDFNEIVCWAKSKRKCKTSVTTNGSIVKYWPNLDVFLDKVTISITSLDPAKMVKIESTGRNSSWIKLVIGNTIKNIERLKNTGIKSRINLVANDRTILDEIKRVKTFTGSDFEIRILNNLNKAEETDALVQDILSEINAVKKSSYKKKSSSSKTIYYNTNLGEISIKQSSTFYFPYLCDKCDLKDKCYEGFYGIRLEKRNGEYFVRLCLYRNDDEVLMPYKEFLNSELKDKYLKLK